MKISKRQLKRIIKEEKARLHKEAFQGSVPSAMVNLEDVDTGRSVSVQISPVPEAEMVTLRFGNSLTLSLDTQSAQDLASSIQDVALDLEDLIAGRNPGGSIG